MDMEEADLGSPLNIALWLKPFHILHTNSTVWYTALSDPSEYHKGLKNCSYEPFPSSCPQNYVIW
jgi:hypothetical protein